VAHQCKYILELARVPARRQNYETAWNRIFEYVDRKYSLEKRMGSDCVYRRRD
jgi:hypothetical protein